MSKFYFTLIGDLRRSIYLISSSSVVIPVDVSLGVDPSRIDANRTDQFKIKFYSKDWQEKFSRYIKSTLRTDELERFEFRFNIYDNKNNDHKVSYDIKIDEANDRILASLKRAKEENRIRYAQDVLQDMQDAYLSQDVNSNDYEQGSRIPDVEE